MAIQEEDPTDPVLAVVWPVGQVVHPLLPVLVLYCPLGQTAQAAPPVENWPAAHGVQMLLTSEEPLAQDEQLEEPTDPALAVV